MDRDRDFADAFEAAFDELCQLVDAACAAETGWPNRAAAGIAAALGFAAAKPRAAQVLTSDAFSNGLYGALRYRRMTTHFAAMLEEGRTERSDGGAGLPEVTEEALLGGIAEVVAERLRAGREATLTTLSPELIELALMPYLGTDRARRVAFERRAP